MALCYCEDNGRPGVEPVLWLGTSILQYLERVPDREAVERLKYHLGWNMVLGREIEEELFHPTSLVRFRQRLIEHEKSKLAFDLVLEGLKQDGLLKESKRQRIDSTHVLGLVAKMSQVECMRETLRLALEEINGKAQEKLLPTFWQELWERYGDSKLDYQLPKEALLEKQRQAGQDRLRLLDWLQQQAEVLQEGEKFTLLARVFGEYYRVEESGQVETLAAKEREVTVVRNPHDPGR